MSAENRSLVSLDWFARIGAASVACLGIVVIMGWLLDIESLKSVLPNLASMKVNTAVCFLVAGVALWLLHADKSGAQSSLLARGLAIFVAAVGVLTLAQDLFPLDLGIDQLLVPEGFYATQTSHPGRMSPVTALNFLFVGAALLVLKAPRSQVAACAPWLTLPPLLLSALATMGYMYGVSSLYQVKAFTSMAAHTALGFFILSLSLLAAGHAHGIAGLAAKDTAGGVVVRRLLPIIPLSLFGLGWARLAGERMGLYGFEFGLALLVLASIIVSVAAIGWTAVSLHHIDTKRKRAESEIRTLNTGLENRVEERTRQLTRTSEQLLAANAALEKLSMQDGLTGLANRRSFDAYIAGQIAVARRHKRPLALILFDVDSFKLYNDHYGHQDGDDCLKRIAAALQSCLRRPGDMAARYGGEEFAMLLPDTDVVGANKVAEAARVAVTQLQISHALSPAASYVTLSGGVAVLLRENNNSAERLISVADENLYRAKALGRNRMVSAQAEAA